MTPERWNRVKHVLSLALKRSSAERRAVLDAAYDDPALRREIETLIDSCEQMGGFLEVPLVPAGPDAFRDAADFSELQQWTRYEIGARLGSGGMAVVYKAWDPRLHRAVAIKLIGGSDEVTVKRFLREAEAQARVDHDNVAVLWGHLRCAGEGSGGSHKGHSVDFPCCSSWRRTSRIAPR